MVWTCSRAQTFSTRSRDRPGKSGIREQFGPSSYQNYAICFLPEAMPLSRNPEFIFGISPERSPVYLWQLPSVPCLMLDLLSFRAYIFSVTGGTPFIRIFYFYRTGGVEFLFRGVNRITGSSQGDSLIGQSYPSLVSSKIPEPRDELSKKLRQLVRQISPSLSCLVCNTNFEFLPKLYGWSCQAPTRRCDIPGMCREGR
jgi:hypothetical protein